MSEKRPCFVGLTVPKYQECVRFYRDAMDIPLKPGEEYVHQECSWHNPYFHFAIFPVGSEHPLLSFWVDDIQGGHERAVANGARVVHGPKRLPWGLTAEYLDPEGNRVSLVQRSNP